MINQNHKGGSMRNRSRLIVPLLMLIAAAGTAAAQEYPIDLAGEQLSVVQIPVEMSMEAYHRVPFSWPCDGLEGEDMHRCLLEQRCTGTISGTEAELTAELVECPGYSGFESYAWNEDGRFYERVLEQTSHRLRLQTWSVFPNLIVHRIVTLAWDGHVPVRWELSDNPEAVYHVVPAFPKNAQPTTPAFR